MPSGDTSFWANSKKIAINTTVASSSRANTGALRLALLKHWLLQDWQPIEMRLAYHPQALNTTAPGHTTVCQSPYMSCQSGWLEAFRYDLARHWEAGEQMARARGIYNPSWEDDYMTKYNFFRVHLDDIRSGDIFRRYRLCNINSQLAVVELLLNDVIMHSIA